MATHSSIPAWKIPWAEEPGRLQSMQSQRVSKTEHECGHPAKKTRFAKERERRTGVGAGPGGGSMSMWRCVSVCVFILFYLFSSGGMPHAFKVLTSTLATAVRLRWVPTLIVITEGPCPSGLFDSLFFPNVKCEFPFLLNKSVELLKMKILFSLSCTMLTYMQSTSWEMLGWRKHKLESRLLEEISVLQICRWYYPHVRKWRRTKEPLDESERGEWKSWLKAQHSGN